MCDNLHLGYNDAMSMSYSERRCMIDYMTKKAESAKKAIEDAKAEAAASIKN